MRISGLGVLVLAPLASAAEPASWQYELQLSADSKALNIEASFPAGTRDGLELSDEAVRFTTQVAVQEGEHWRPLSRSGDSWTVAHCAGGCRVRYRFDLLGLAHATGDPNGAEAEDDVFVTSPGNWLMRPEEVAGNPGLSLHVKLPPGKRFAIGWRSAPGVEGSYLARAQDIDLAPYAVFGPIDLTTAKVGERTVQIALGPKQSAERAARLRSWVKLSAEAVQRYLGAFPIDQTLVVVIPSGGHQMNGRTMGSGGATVLLWLGADVSDDEMRGDWVLVHELSHLMLPTVPRRSHWMEEGLATYVEPLARLRVGTMDAQGVWSQLLWGLPKGLPESDDEGLDNTPTWGRTYWGGALFWFIGDVRIRQRTQNRCTVEDALRGVAAAGGSLAEQWPVADILKAADKAVGGHELEQLYEEWAPRPGSVDLKGLFTKLGVSGGREVVFDDRAPLSGIRKAITSTEPSACRVGAASGDAPHGTGR